MIHRTARTASVRLVGLLLVSALAVAACSSDADTNADPSTTVGTQTSTTLTEVPVADPDSDLAALCPATTPTQPVTLELWHAMPVELGEALTALTDRYNASQNLVTVNLVFQGSYDDTLDKYLTALRGGTRPALIQLEETATQLAIDADSFVPMQACVDSAGYSFEDYIERTVTAFTVNDTLWPMPFNISNPILYANAGMLAAAGVTELPTTLDEIRAAAQKVVDTGVAPAGITLISSAWNIEQMFGLADLPFADGGNGRVERASELLIDNELGLEIFTWMSEMVADGLATFVGSGDNNEHLIALAVGQAALTVSTTAALRSVKIGAATFGVEVAVGPMPSAGPRTGGALVGGGALWLDSTTSEDERAGAWDFVTWLTAPEQMAFWHANTGYIPIRRSAIDLPEIAELWATEPEFQVAYDQLVQGRETIATSGPVVGNHSQVRSRAIVPAIEKLLIQGLDPAVALAEATAEANRIIADYTRRLGG
jgi:sn-glycerol 3-phosphate transport system substrate-binding protein